jgi:hypothetical protein
MEPAIAELKNTHHPAAKFLRREHLENRATRGTPDGVHGADKRQQR